jgi:hypothetical protein
MVETIACPIADLGMDFPDTVFVLHHPPTNKFGCFCIKSVHGLACFSTENNAYRFSEWLELSGMAALQVTFDEARDIAKDRPTYVVSLMLLDDMNNPVIHYVR